MATPKKQKTTGRRAPRAAADPLAPLREALAIGDVLDQLDQSESTDTLLERILECAVRSLGTEEGSITQLDVRKGELYFRVAHSRAQRELKKIRIPISAGVLGYVARSAQALCVEDVTQDERFDQSVDQAVGFTTRSLVAAPILDGGKVQGVLELVNLEGDEHVTREDLTILGLFAEAVAIVFRQERRRKGTLAFVERALKRSDLDPESRALVDAVTRNLGQYKKDSSYRRSLRLAALVRAVSTRGEEESRLAEQVLSKLVDYLDRDGGG